MTFSKVGWVIVAVSVAVVSSSVSDTQSRSAPYSSNSGSDGHVCSLDYGKEANYDDYDCKSYYSCSDYWGTLYYCPSGHQFHFDHKECLEDDQVLCKWQLEYYGGSGSSGSSGSSWSSGSSGSLDSGSNYDRSCKVSYGLEPNYYDHECKSYYSCDDYWGKLSYCPSGYQFHFDYLSCEKDEDVLCQWQLEHYEKYGSSSSSSLTLRRQRRRPNRFRSSGSSASASASYSESGMSSYDSGDSSEGHVCSIASGYEPNFDDSDECATYWSCEDYWGTLQRCHGSDQFHFQYKMCMNDDDVSCWVQMEKHYHGHSYSDDGSSESYSSSKTCDVSSGQEPNYYDEGCKSYWYCEDHYGTLHECPVHYQFDWGKLDCVLDEELSCEKQQEYFYEHMYYDAIHSDDDSYDHSGVHHGSSDYDYHSGSLRRPAGKKQQRCDVDYGRQPDYSSEDCTSYWSCSGYRGSWEKCPRGYQFHWQEGECLKDEFVRCWRQKNSSPYFKGSKRQ